MPERPLRALLALALATALLAAAPSRAAAGERLVVASKNFTESRLLGEILRQLVEARTDLEVEHRAGLGGTLVCWEALRAGEIDLYPEYTGTAWSIVLEEPGRVSDPLQTFLHVQRECRERHDVEWAAPFGFRNSYALAMREDRAEALGVRAISDLLGRGADLRAGFSIEYMNREDGWPGLQPFYGLELGEVRTLEHGLAYEAVDAGSIDLIDAYTTDAKLERFDLRLLVDDRGFYPPYDAAPVVRRGALRAHPELREALEALAFTISDREMVRLNHAVEVEERGFEEVAAGFLRDAGLLEPTPRSDEDGGASARGAAGRAPELLRLLGEHVLLTLAAVGLATLVAVPLGVLATRRPLVGRVALGVASAVQTIPSLALLAFMIAVPGLGLSVRSAVTALMLYALLPILRNTYTGIREVAPELVDAARGLGLTDRQVLLRVELPLARRTLLAGVRTATVISIGVATLAAFIGAGGLGEPIVTGLYLNDVGLILSGAVPAALLALAADRGLGLLERRLEPGRAARRS
jgi:osmoprotectant transport system permease protein